MKHPDAGPEHILIVEDDRALRQLLADELTDAGYVVDTAADVDSALAYLGATPVRLVISDLRLPGRSGLDLLMELQTRNPRPAFIMITAFGTVEQAVDALKKGADDFLTKPLKLDHLRISVERVMQRRKLQEEVARFRKLVGGAGFHEMVGRSAAMQRLFDVIRMVARADGPVLLTGESGTGKELVARALHAESKRRDGPFIAVNCAGIPPALLEAELFGHTASAFTGADRARKGLFAEADNGTLLLDEVGEMPLEMQAKLLRILQDGRIRPIGSNQEAQLDVRIIAATNRRLEDEVREKRFREDLYFRLETFTIEVPPLRERGDDIELLAMHLLNQFSLKLQRNIHGISGEALERLRTHPFPGNVRELSSIIERAVTFARGRDITLQDLPERLRGTGAYSSGLLLLQELNATQAELPSLGELEQRYINLVLEKVGGNKRKAAAVLGIGRRTLYRRLDADSDKELPDQGQ